jgi:hypothetical protein
MQSFVRQRSDQQRRVLNLLKRWMKRERGARIAQVVGRCPYAFKHVNRREVSEAILNTPTVAEKAIDPRPVLVE